MLFFHRRTGTPLTWPTFRIVEQSSMMPILNRIKITKQGSCGALVQQYSTIKRRILAIYDSISDAYTAHDYSCQARYRSLQQRETQYVIQCFISLRSPTHNGHPCTGYKHCRFIDADLTVDIASVTLTRIKQLNIPVTNSNQCMLAVTHPSTNRTQCWLTLLINLEPYL